MTPPPSSAVGRLQALHAARRPAAFFLLTTLAAAALTWLAGAEDPPLLWPLGIGLLAGSLLAACQRHPYRSPGLVPAGATLLLAALAWAALAGIGQGPLVLAGAGAALAVLPLGWHLLALRRIGPLPGIALFAAAVLLGVGAARLGPSSLLQPLLLVAGTLATVLAWAAFIRPAFETLVEAVDTVLYRVTARGPGLDAFPHEGPVLVIANHTCYLDPVWLFQALPRPLTAMATSLYYDRPLLNPLARILGILRVEVAGFRREVPELDAAVAALDRGECVLLFPEGWVRRQEGQVRRFGQGVWRILQNRPDTPVIVCWIEGGWGSWTSYAGGPPFKGKRLDIRRPVSIAVEGPLVLDRALLDDGPAARAFLRRACLDARRQLELPPLDAGNAGGIDDAGADHDPGPSAAAPAGDPPEGAKSGENP